MHGSSYEKSYKQHCKPNFSFSNRDCACCLNLLWFETILRLLAVVTQFTSCLLFYLTVLQYVNSDSLRETTAGALLLCVHSLDKSTFKTFSPLNTFSITCFIVPVLVSYYCMNVMCTLRSCLFFNYKQTTCSKSIALEQCFSTGAL